MRAEEVAIDIGKLHALQAFSSFFKEGQIEQLAKESGFITRSSSRLTGEAFLKMMVEHLAPYKEWSLNDQCEYLWEQYGIEMTKQSLDERYHCFTVSFLKRCYETILAQRLRNPVKGIPCHFNGIYLTDSTSFQLPAHLAPFYQSNGGATSGASVKIHQSIELLKFQVQDLCITDGKASDGNYWKTKGFHLGKNNLWIADLGYFSWKTLREIAGSGNYFISRYKTGTTLYLKDQQESYTPLSIAQWVKEHCRDGEGITSMEVYWGNDKIKARLIYEQVPEEVKQERLQQYKRRHANQSQKGRHWAMTTLKEVLCGYNLYLTNTTVDQIANEQVFLIYALRWQIELLFKIWKSLLFIDKVGQMNIFRFECFLYGRLIFILLSTEFVAFIKSTLQEATIEVEISEWKTIKLIKKNSIH
jgi:hypothetical protein